MGKITGYDNDFTTVKQVNDALTGTDSNDFIGYPFTIHMVIPNLNKFVGISYNSKIYFTLNPTFEGYETLRGMTVKTGQTPALPYIKYQRINIKTILDQVLIGKLIYVIMS